MSGVAGSLRGNRNFQRLFWATGITNLGDGISAMAVPWLAATITRDPCLVALVTFAMRMPWLLFSLPAGVVIDRADRRRLILRADILRTVLTALVVGIAMTLPAAPDTPAIWIGVLAVVTFLLGTAEVFRDNAAQTILPSIVEGGALEEANGRMWSVEHVTSLIGPPLAGGLIALAMPLPFIVDAATFALAALLIAKITLPPRTASPAQRSLRSELAEGWAWLREARVIFQLALMLGAFNFAAAMAMVTLVLYSQDILGLGALGHGALLACGAAGGVLGGLFGPKLVARFGGQRVIYMSLALNLVGLGLYAVTGSAIVAGLSEGLMLFGGVIWNVVTVSYRQRHIPDHLLGRVNAIYRFFGWGSISIAMLTAGALARSLEAEIGREMALRVPYGLGAFIVFGLLAYALTRLRLTDD